MKPYDIFRMLKIDKPAKFLQDTAINSLVECKKVAYKKTKLSQLRHQTTRSKKILIAAYDTGIGNAIEATPLIQAARSLWPTAKIVFLTNSADLFQNWCIPDIVTSKLSDLEDITFDISFIAFTGQYKTPAWTKNYNLGKVLYPKIALKSYFLMPERDYNLKMIRKFGFKGPTPPVYVSMTKPDIKLPESLKVGILPCAQKDRPWNLKRWPYYSELVRKLLEIPDLSIIIFGTHDDKIEGKLPQDKRIVDLRGKTSLTETAYILKKCDMIVGNDCGPAHIAAAVNANQLILFGPTCTIKNRPQTGRILSSTSCRFAPCQYRKIINTCKKQQCLYDISVEQVLNIIKKGLHDK